jgi:hypothetical protein
MQLLIYAPPFIAAGHLLRRMLAGWDGARGCHYFTVISALTAYLRQPLGLPSICLLAPADGRELNQLNSMRHLLRDMRIILVLPDSQPQTISEAHYLRPRYIAYADGNLDDVKAVVDRMFEMHACGRLRAAG